MPVFVGADGPSLPDYSARWSFEEKGYLLAEMNEAVPQQLNRGVAQADDAAVGEHSATFDGASYLRNHVGHWDASPLFLRPYANFTLSLWVKPDAPADGTQVLYEEGGSGSGSALALRIHDGKLEAGIFEAGALHTVAAPAPPAGQWTHVALVFDGTARRMTLWVNGREAAATPVPTDKLSKRSLASAIGARLQQDAFNNTGDKEDAADFFRGKLDEIRLYERALDEAAIRDLHAAGGNAGE